MKSVNIIGAGNVGYHLAIALHKANYSINTVYNRTLVKAKELATLVNATFANKLDEIGFADTNIVCVSDDAVVKIIAQMSIAFGKQVNIVHTSGVLDLTVFGDGVKNCGCLYPLQSLVKGEIVDFSNIPICVDATPDIFMEQISSLAQSISEKVVHLPSYKKKYLHLAAVFANNFTNHMFYIAKEICKQNEIEFDIVVPLINRSMHKVNSQDPMMIQTGPARRKDVKTINAHKNLLKDEGLMLLYSVITKSILRTYHEDH